MLETCYRNKTLPSRQNAVRRLCVFPRTVAHWRGGFSTGATMKLDKRFVHGDNRRGIRVTEYDIWSRMIQRCHNPNCFKYPIYGGRGIFVCDRWKRSYVNFLADMGRRPAGTSLERKNNSLGYFKGNCKWATLLEQANNRRDNHCITHNGVTATIAQWARKLGVRRGLIAKRVYRGWPISAVIEAPAGTFLVNITNKE